MFLIDGKCYECNDIEGYGSDARIGISKLFNKTVFHTKCREVCGDGLNLG